MTRWIAPGVASVLLLMGCPSSTHAGGAPRIELRHRSFDNTLAAWEFRPDDFERFNGAVTYMFSAAQCFTACCSLDVLEPLLQSVAAEDAPAAAAIRRDPMAFVRVTTVTDYPSAARPVITVQVGTVESGVARVRVQRTLQLRPGAWTWVDRGRLRCQVRLVAP